MAPDAASTNSIVLPYPITVHPLDPQEIWSRHVQARRVVYVDTNVWVHLTDARTSLSRECLMLCREAVSSGAAIFPLSFASISELLHQPPAAPRDAQAGLMDELSLGVSFRSAPIIQQEEARAAFRFFASEEYQPVPRSAVFTYVVNYLADGTIIFPEGSTAAQVRALVEHWNTTPDVRSVSWLLKHMDLNEIKENHKASEKTFVECFSDSIKQNSAHFRKARQFSSARARHEERIGLFNSAILPSFQKIMFERYTPDNIPKEMRAISEEFGKRHGRGSPRVLEKLFSLMPAIELFAQLMAARNLNPERAVQPQDFWDIEHARVSGAYADAFATVDRGLIDLLGSRSSVPRTRGCRIIRGLGPLASLLREYTNAVERTS